MACDLACIEGKCSFTSPAKLSSTLYHEPGCDISLLMVFSLSVIREETKPAARIGGPVQDVVNESILTHPIFGR